MSVELKNWKELCKEKDERIKELEGKFDLIVERLEEKSDNIPIQYEYNYDQGFDDGICYSIDIVEEVGGMND